MSLVRWDPFRDVTSLQNSINRIFDDKFGYLRPMESTNLTQSWIFPVDIKDTPEAVVIHAEIPGVSREDISLSYNDKILTIRGERKNEVKEEEANYIKVERKYGAFSRSFSVDVSIEQEKIRACYKEGVLEVTLPKKEQDKSKEIEIEVK